MLDAAARHVVAQRSFADTIFEDGATVNIAGLCRPQIIPEIVFGLGAALPSDCYTEWDVRSVTEYVVAAIRIVDDELSQLVIGAGQHPPWRFDLTDIDAVLFSGYPGREVAVTRGNSRPLSAMTRSLRNAALSAGASDGGQIIVTAACTNAVDVGIGDRFRAEFVDIGSVSVEFH